MFCRVTTKQFEKTRGWQAVVELCERMTQVELSKATGVTQSTISQICSLQRQPGLDGALNFQKVGIPTSWWRMPPRSKASGIKLPPSQGGSGEAA